jgi:hypothetical protein
MRIHQGLPIFLALLIGAASAVTAFAQQAQPSGATAPTPAQRPARPKPPAPKPAAPKPAAAAEAKPTLLAQFAEWGAYTASLNGKKICFAIAKPTSAETKPPGRPRDQPFMFITTRPADKVANEVSVTVGYPFKTSSEASVTVGPTTFALYTQGNGAWIKNAAEESHMIDAMRQGDTALVKGESSRGTESVDTYSLKGLAEALDRTAQECQ